MLYDCCVPQSKMASVPLTKLDDASPGILQRGNETRNVICHNPNLVIIAVSIKKRLGEFDRVSRVCKHGIPF